METQFVSMINHLTYNSNLMKLIISTDSKEKEAKVSDIFGRCKYFGIYDTDSKELKFVENPGTTQPRGAGIAAAQEVVDQGVEKVVTGHVGPNAGNVLEDNEVEVVIVSEKTVQDIIDENAA